MRSSAHLNGRMRLPHIIAFAGLTLALLAFPSCSWSQAANIYLAQSAAGAANGADCNDAYAYTFFNTAANWGTTANKIGPGTTVYMCGTFTASAGTNNYLTFQGSGSSSNPVTFAFNSGAIIQAPYWGTGTANSGTVINTGSYNYITVNGTGGTIQATENGTNLMYQEGSGTCVSGTGSNIIVENVTCQNMYVHVAGADTADSSSGCIYFVGGNNVTIENNVCHDMHWAIGYNMGGSNSSNIRISGNNAYNTDHGVFAGDCTGCTSTVNNLNIYGNLIHDFANWDNPSDAYHHDGVHVFTNNSGTTFSGINVYNNQFYGSMGSYANALIFIESYDGPGTIVGLAVFNNVLAPASGTVNGAVDDNSTRGGIIVNNTSLGLPGALASIAGSEYDPTSNSNGPTMENNILIGTGAATYSFLYGATQSNYSGTVYINVSDYNDFYQFSGNNNFLYGGCCANSLAQWQSLTSQDAHSITGNPSLSNYVPQTGSAVIGAGANLSSLCSGAPNPGLGALCYDAAGNQRPSSGGWTAGAYQAGSTASSSGGPQSGSAPNPPTSLTVTMN